MQNILEVFYAMQCREGSQEEAVQKIEKFFVSK